MQTKFLKGYYLSLEGIQKGNLLCHRGASPYKTFLFTPPPPSWRSLYRGLRYTEVRYIGFPLLKSEYDESRLTLRYQQFELTSLQFKCHKSTD